MDLEPGPAEGLAVATSTGRICRINAIIDQGAIGKIVEVEDEAEHRTIEVWVE